MITRIARVTLVLLAIWQLCLASPAWGLITGGEGNEPINDPGWPIGAAVIFNHESRVAYWEGPPFGGGQWHAEGKGDAAAFSKVLADFAKLDVKNKRVVLHDGIGQSFWLNIGREPAKAKAAEIDWTFMVWLPANWERQRKLPPDLSPPRADDETTPPSQIDVYTGGALRWADVKVPAGLTIVDERLEAHGFQATDGVVLVGKIIALETQKPLAAQVYCELVERKPAGNGYQYKLLKEVKTDEQGAWVIKNTPAGQFRICARREGYVPRVIGYGRSDEQPRWQTFGVQGLAKPAVVKGLVVDEANKPLVDVEVQLSNVVAQSTRYDSPDEYRTKSDAQGNFVFDQVPTGNASVWMHKAGYCRPGLGLAIAAPSSDIKLTMLKAASIKVVVGFGTAMPPAGYIVHVIPEGGEAVGKWSGSGNIDSTNQITFKDMPPGKYVIYGRPNPGRDADQTDPIPVELQGGQTTELVITAK